MFYGIAYLLTNSITGRQYIGITKHSLDTRFKQHCYMRGRKMAFLQKALAKHGPEAFHKDVIFVAFDLDALNAAEVQLIIDYKTLAPLGYNLRSGGGQAAVHPLTCKKISDARKGWVPSAATKIKMRNRMLHHPTNPTKQDAARCKMSMASKGKPKSPEHRAAISLAMRNRISRR